MMFRKILAAAAVALAAGLPAGAEVSIKEVTSPGGIKAWLSEDHNIPFTALEIRFKGGTSLDQPSKAGATNMMTALLEEGSGEMDSRSFAEARADLASGYLFNAGVDTISVSAHFLTENRDASVALLAQALAEPRFDADAVERVRGQVLSQIRSDERNPHVIANRAFLAMTFGDHPYARSSEGTLESVAGLNRDDLIEAHRNALVRDRIVVSAAGDINAEELGALLDKLFGALPKSGPELVGKAPWNLAPGVSVIDYPSPQSVVYFGAAGIKQDDPDFFAAYLLNEVFGGARFSARLMTEVREKRGLTYGIGTSLISREQSEIFMGQFSASNDKIAEAITVIRAEWNKLASEGITEAELATTKTYLTGSYPLRFDGNSQIAGVLTGMQLAGLDADYITTRNDQINAVTMEDINRVAARLFPKDGLHFVVTGRPEGVTSIP